MKIDALVKIVKILDLCNKPLIFSYFLFFFLFPFFSFSFSIPSFPYFPKTADNALSLRSSLEIDFKRFLLIFSNNKIFKDL